MDFSKIDIKTMSAQFLYSNYYKGETKIEYIEYCIAKNSDVAYQKHILNNFLIYFTPATVSEATKNIFPQTNYLSESQLRKHHEKSKKYFAKLFGIVTDFDETLFKGQDTNYYTHVKVKEWIEYVLKQLNEVETVTIKTRFHPSEVAALYKIFIEKGWVEGDFDGKANWSKFSRIFLSAFEVRNPEGDLVSPSGLAAKFNEGRNKAKEFKKDFEKGINNISFYRKKEKEPS